MEQPQYLIDTNAVIDYLGRKLPEKGMNFISGVMDKMPQVSVVTKIEVLGFSAPEEYYQLLISFMNDVNVLDLTGKVVDISIELRKKYRTKLPDAIIAATALAYNYTLITNDEKDFYHIENLKIINPYKLTD